MNQEKWSFEINNILSGIDGEIRSHKILEVVKLSADAKSLHIKVKLDKNSTKRGHKFKFFPLGEKINTLYKEIGSVDVGYNIKIHHFESKF